MKQRERERERERERGAYSKTEREENETYSPTLYTRHFHGLFLLDSPFSHFLLDSVLVLGCQPDFTIVFAAAATKQSSSSSVDFCFV